MSLTGQWQFLVVLQVGNRRKSVIDRSMTFLNKALKKCHWPVDDSFGSYYKWGIAEKVSLTGQWQFWIVLQVGNRRKKCHWPVNDSFEALIMLELMAMCHWLQSITQNLWTFVIDHSQWQKFMAKLAKKCHWPRSMTKKSVIVWMYTMTKNSVIDWMYTMTFFLRFRNCTTVLKRVVHQVKYMTFTRRCRMFF